MFKAIVIAFLAVGVLGDEYKVSDVHRDQMRALLRTQCKKNGAEDKVESVEQAGQVFVDCVKEIINVEILKDEIEAAKPTGSLDEVFKKYCDKSPKLKTCWHNLLDGVMPCLDATAQEQIGSAKNGTDQLIDFLCYKDGDRIAMFIAEKGPECFQQKANDLRECANKIKESVSTVEAAKNLNLAEKCAKFDELTTCVVNSLEKCDTPTPANMVESLLKYMRKGSPCNSTSVKNVLY
ncbi:hypothetical protein K1T71_004328 [Dendrolimus kikuchii]|uniref:Uncharacterized protein n=1 Tax=Dendrolimus kikuchii TaxID=765133 RepID=A0ACC1D8J9_9NEOP|nr:hypothetical protein K1T71_004328 [Dendrolimus kikuchii]